MKDDLNILENGTTSKISKWKLTLIFWQMQDDLNILALPGHVAGQPGGWRNLN
jgi:hypothetical protein